MEVEVVLQAVYLISLSGFGSTRRATGTAGVESAKIAAL